MYYTYVQVHPSTLHYNSYSLHVEYTVRVNVKSRQIERTTTQLQQGQPFLHKLAPQLGFKPLDTLYSR